MSFFKKIMGLFREEIDDEEFEQPAEPTVDEKPVSQKPEEQPAPYVFHERPPETPEMKAKVTYRYPSRELGLSQPERVQLQPRRKRRIRLEREDFPGNTLEAEQGYTYEPEEKVYSAQPVQASEAYKPPSGPFKPTEVPSPIYGFQKRPMPAEDKKAETELNHQEESSPIVHEEAPELQTVNIEEEEKVLFTPAAPVETEAPAPKLPKEEPLLLFKPEDKKKVFDVEAAPLFAVEEAAATVAEPAQKEEPAVFVPEEKTEEQIEEKAEEKLAMPENPTGKLPEEKKVSRAEKRSHKRRQTPFNVIMSKQDRELLKKRHEQPPVLLEESLSVQEDDLALPQEEEQEGLTPPAAAEEKQGEAASDSEPEYYVFPYETYLSPPVVKEASRELVDAQSEVLNETFKNFNVKASVVNVTVGPSVTRFEVEPERGVKVSKITNLTDDIKRSLAARNIRIEAPIPGTQVIGIEVPNKESRPVQISEIISSPAFAENSSPLTSALGLDISGEPVVLDLKKMPHGLIAGATGSGKSVCINSILVSLLYKAAPHELKLMLIDPKMVELAPYNGIPHLVSPVITDVKAATAALKWAVEEMERRYELFVHSGVRDITKYNEKAEAHGRKSEHLPYIVIIIDELADLMMMSPADVEEAICRIAQKARACGIHLIVATQRPSVDVITGLIKANIPTRIAFSVSSQVDSRTIIDTGGAEKLLGRGDMLFLNNGASETVRLQGTFVSDDEIDTIVAHVRREQEPNYLFEQEELLQKAAISETEDELFPEACEFVVQQGGASTSLLQRHFKIGYNRAARLIEMMETQGFVSGQRAGRPREVLLTEEELQALHDSHGN